MTSVFCKSLYDIKIDTINSNQYSFLKLYDKYNIDSIYNLLNSQKDYKIKNLYRFIYLRTNKLKNLFPKLNKLINHKSYMSPLIFNTLMDEYIKNNEINEIIIVNSILTYFYPS